MAKKLPRLPTMGVCTYKLLENAFAKSIKPPPVKPYTILEIKTEKKKMFTFYLYRAVNRVAIFSEAKQDTKKNHQGL